MGIGAPIALLYFIRMELKERKRDEEEQEELEGLIPDPDDDEDDEPAPQRSRYGGQRRNPYAKFEARREDRF